MWARSWSLWLKIEQLVNAIHMIHDFYYIYKHENACRHKLCKDVPDGNLIHNLKRLLETWQKVNKAIQCKLMLNKIMVI